MATDKGTQGTPKGAKQCAEIGDTPDTHKRGKAMRDQKHKDRGGRPSKWTMANTMAILARLAEGYDRDEAAKASGVSRATMAAWMAQGKAGEQPYADFRAAVIKLERSGGLDGLLRQSAKRSEAAGFQAPSHLAQVAEQVDEIQEPDVR